jgi:peroxiredoxin
MIHQSGQRAPEFETRDIAGQAVGTKTFFGRPWLLSFFRYSTCALCNLRVHQLIEAYPEYRRRGLEVVAVFESSADNVRANVGKQRVPFPLVADPETRLYDLFGVEVSEAKVQASMARDLAPQIAAAAAIGYPLAREDGGNFYRMPADFLIAPNGTFAAVFYSDFVGTHLPHAVIEEFLSAGVQ